jgi:hypothetical protein
MRYAAALLLGLLVALALAPRASAADSPDSCVRFWGEARYGALGYNHLVHIANSCAAPAECKVSTDVNPDEQDVVVAGRSQVMVSTFLGSPARTFTPHVKCTMH